MDRMMQDPAASPSPRLGLSPVGGSSGMCADPDADAIDRDLFDDLAALLGESDASGNTQTAEKSLERKCDILESTVRQLKAFEQGGGDDIASVLISDSGGMKKSLWDVLMPRHVVGPLVLDALDGFLFLITDEGRIEMVAENVKDYLNLASSDLEGRSVYDVIHPGDRARFSVNLLKDDSGALIRIKVGYGRGTFLKSKAFTCRFCRTARAIDEESNVGDDFYMMEVSCVPIDDEPSVPKQVNGKDISQAKLFCVARRVGKREKAQYFPVEMFTTKLDPANNFRVVAVDTTGMNQVMATTIMKTMLDRCLVDLCYPKDKDLLQEHLLECLRETVHISRVYRLRILGRPNDFVHVQTKSKSFGPQNADADAVMATGVAPCKSYIMATHSIVGETELCPEDLPAATEQYRQELQQQKLDRLQLESSEAGDSTSTGSHVNSRLSQMLSKSRNAPTSAGNSERKSPLAPALQSPVDNNNISKLHLSALQAGASEENEAGSGDEHQQKNQLLKHLLNVTFSSDRMTSTVTTPGASTSSSASASAATSSRILQLLSQSKENVPRKEETSPVATAVAGVKRGNSFGGEAEGEPSAKVAAQRQSCSSPASTSSPSSVCKQNPSLANLLSKPAHGSVNVPPPVPTKWHQEPKEKLPKSEEILKSYLHSSDRPLTQPQPQQQSSARTATLSQPMDPLQMPMLDTASDLDPSDDLLSDILDDVIDIQEKSPSILPLGGGILQPRSVPAQQGPFAKSSPLSTEVNEIEIANIEKFLASTESSIERQSAASFQRSVSTPMATMAGRDFSAQQHMSGGGLMTSEHPRGNNNTLDMRLMQQQQQQQQQQQPHFQMHPHSQQQHALALRRQLQAVPPNVTVSLSEASDLNRQLQTGPPNVAVGPEMDALALMQQQQRRRSASGGPQYPVRPQYMQMQQQKSPNYAPQPHMQRLPQQHQQQLHLLQQQSRPMMHPGAMSAPVMGSSGNPLLLQQLNSAPLNQQQRQQLMQQMQQQQMRPQQMTMAPSHPQMHYGGQQGLANRLPAPQQQQAMAHLQGHPSVMGHLMSPDASHGLGSPEDSRSLLQQLLSE